MFRSQNLPAWRVIQTQPKNFAAKYPQFKTARQIVIEAGIGSLRSAHNLGTLLIQVIEE